MHISDITNRSYTGPDFLAMLEKRVRKHVRLQELVQTGECYCFDTPDSLAAAYLKHVLEQIFADRISFSTEGTTLLTQTLDEWISERTTAILEHKELPTIKLSSPLQVVSNKELLIAAELLGLEGTQPKATHTFVEELHKIYPQTKSSFLKSFLYIEQLLEDSSKKTE